MRVLYHASENRAPADVCRQPLRLNSAARTKFSLLLFFSFRTLPADRVHDSRCASTTPTGSVPLCPCATAWSNLAPPHLPWNLHQPPDRNHDGASSLQVPTLCRLGYVRKLTSVHLTVCERTPGQLRLDCSPRRPLDGHRRPRHRDGRHALVPARILAEHILAYLAARHQRPSRASVIPPFESDLPEIGRSHE